MSEKVGRACGMWQVSKQVGRACECGRRMDHATSRRSSIERVPPRSSSRSSPITGEPMFGASWHGPRQGSTWNTVQCILCDHGDASEPYPPRAAGAHLLSALAAPTILGLFCPEPSAAIRIPGIKFRQLSQPLELIFF